MRAIISKSNIKFNGTPEKIKPYIPKSLHSNGNPNLLKKQKVAIIGKRYPGKRGKLFAKISAASITKANATVVSGNAKGIDHEAHDSAMHINSLGSEKTEDTGTSIFILPHGLQWFYKSHYPTISEKKWKSHALILSQFKNTERFSGKNAMTRSRLICMLSDGVVVIESDPEKVRRVDGRLRSSGTFTTAKFAIEFGIPVLVVHPDKFDYDVPGNQALIEAGATAITHSDDILKLLSGR